MNVSIKNERGKILKHYLSIGILIAFVCFLAACNSEPTSNIDKVIGIWKSTDEYPQVYYITKETVRSRYDTKPTAVNFRDTWDGKVIIATAQTNKILCRVSEFKDNSAFFDFGRAQSNKTFFRTTQEDVDKLKSYRTWP
jgi:hypothetical protein